MQPDSILGKSVVQVYTRIETPSGVVGRRCSGALVAFRRVLTSAWCVGAEELDDPLTLVQRNVGTGPLVDRAAYDGTGTTFRDMRFVDGLVILVLASDLPGGVPFGLADAPANGTAVTAYSYGCIEDGQPSWGVLNKRRLTWNEWAGSNGTDFLCDVGDDGAVLVNPNGKWVGVVPSSRSLRVIPISNAIREAIAKP